MLSWDDRVENMLTYMAMPATSSASLTPWHFSGSLAMCLTPDCEDKEKEVIRLDLPRLAAPRDIVISCEPAEADAYQFMRIRKRSGGVSFALGWRWRRTDEWKARTIKFMQKNGDWHPVRREMEPSHIEVAADRIFLAAALERWQSTVWRTRLAWDGCPAITIPTSPAGIIDLFRLRDIPNGASRRQALLHWVRSHSRSLRNGSVAEVKAHLRGESRFAWNGLSCEIVPSEQDAAVWKAA